MTGPGQKKRDSDPRASSESADNSSSAPLKNKIPSKPGSKRIDVSVDDFVRSVESESAKDRAETTNISSSGPVIDAFSFLFLQPG